MKARVVGLSLILCLALCISLACVFTATDVAAAENVDVLVSLDDDSLLTAYGDCFAYTNGKSIYLAMDNKLLSFDEQSDFDYFIDIAMNSTHIMALTQKGEEKYLWAYYYSSLGITKVNNYTPTGINLNYLVGIYADCQGTLYAMETNKVDLIYIDGSESTSYKFPCNTSPEDGLYSDVTSFVVEGDVLYCILDGGLYAISDEQINDPDLSGYFKRDGNYIDLTVSADNVLLLSAGGVYAYDNTNASVTTLSVNGLNEHSKICSAFDSKSGVDYVYAKSNLNAINMYVYAQGNLEYYGCFDNTVYTHPTEYDIVKLYKADMDITLYSSPRHLQRMGTIPVGSYFLALSQRDDYLYVYYQDSQEEKKGYIKISSSITLCPASEECQYGDFLQPLHQNTTIYKYPFSSEKLLIDPPPITMQLVFIDNVGQDGAYTWGWYKVGFVNSAGKTTYGYVKSVDVSPYTQLTAPSLSKAVKLTSKKLGQYITIYALPFDNQEDAIEVAQLPEGTSVYLKEKFNKKSTWTAIYYEGKTAYVKTANVKASGLTSWQIVLIVTIPCVAIAIAVAVTLVVLAKRKKRIYNYY